MRFGVSSRKGKELQCGNESKGRWRCLDVDGNLRGHKVDSLLVCRQSRCRLRISLHPRSENAACNRVQLTTDGHRAYLTAVEDAFGCEVDYAMLQKIYGTVQDKPETRYSPAACMGARKAIITGSPDHNHISTSFAERQNLTMRMSMRRFTRLTNGFSKKLQNHEHALALHFMYYNFCRIHQTLRVTPAMEAGVCDRLEH